MSDQQTMFIFPGQGSQYVGMGSDIYEAFPAVRDIYQQANDILGFDIQKLSFEGPADQLNKTRFTQPALLTHSIACLEAFKSLTDDKVKPVLAAGHSLGEYSALVAAGVLSFETALRLVQRRGELMGTFGRGKMMAFKTDLETIRPFADHFYCGIGGCNLPEQTVVGGTEEDLAALAEHAAEHKLRGIPLNTEGAFHTYLMVTAAEAFRPDLDKAEFNTTDCKILSNYTGDYHGESADSIRSALFFQLFHPVKWIWSIQRAIEDGIDFIVEFGGGIGKGEGPAEKRPNLQSITKRAYKGMGKEGVYHPAINLPTLEKTTQAILESV